MTFARIFAIAFVVIAVCVVLGLGFIGVFVAVPVAAIINELMRSGKRRH